MKALAGLAFAVIAAVTPIDRALAYNRAQIKQLVVEEALNSRVPPSLALAVAKVESDFQARALSTAGARGVMQILPRTAEGVFGVAADELWDARLNIQLGIDFLEQLIDRYGGRWELALSHYNGGSLAGRGKDAEPHAYTRKFVDKVLRWQRRYADQARIWAQTEPPARHDETGDREIAPPVPPAPIPPAPVVTARVVAASGPERTARQDLDDGSLDDFGGPLEQRRILSRQGLDDFAPFARRSAS